MENEKCLNNEISYFHFWIAFIAVILIMFLICVCVLIVTGFPIQFLPILIIDILLRIFVLDIIMQFVVYVYQKYKYNKALQDNWKHPTKSLYYGSCLKFPDFIRECFSKFGSHIVEPVIFYHFICHFNLIKKGWNCAVNNRHYNSENEHDAIIVNIYSLLAREYIFGDGIDLLIIFFNKKHINYKIYCCNNSEDFFKIVNNPKATSLWIFGHGSRGGIKCRDKYVDYSTLVNNLSPISKFKRYIYQFHCNSKGEKSLTEYLSNGRGFAHYKTIDKGGEVRGYLKNILNDESWNN